MLHELLLALLGFTGDLIVDEREQRKTLGLAFNSDSPLSDECTFKLAPDISFIEPSERDLIERLIKLGFYYRELDRFAKKSRNLSWIRSVVTSVHPLERADELSKQSREKKPSVYRRAIANGIGEILSVYRSAVLQIEQKLLAETTPILATVTQGLNKFFVLFPPLYEVILEIERDDIRGGQLLNVLNKRCHCGVPELRTCLQRLLWHGHQVMYNQLAAWIVYGILQDPHGEFFIKRQEDGDLDHRSSQEEISEKLARTSVHETSLTDWHSGFHISLDMLPDYISMRLGESILFAGKAIRVLRNPSPAFQFQKDKSFQQTMRGSQRIRGFMHSDFPERETEIDTDLTGGELLPQSEADKIEAMLKELKESSEFHKRSFECTVDSVRAIAASHLWQLVVVRADLNGHLKALKDYFLLEKGDFFQCFLEESRPLMRLPPRQSTGESDLMVPFQLAATKTIAEEDKYFSRVSLRMPSFGVTVRSSQAELARSKASLAGKANYTSDTSVDGWDAIALEYSVDWPMQLFFTQEVLSKYLKVFQYLIRLKRTQMELEKSWASVMHQDHVESAQHRKDGTNGSTSQQRRQGIRPMWRVREHMAFLIRNLQFYIQVDVIESQWKVLQTHIHDSQDFTELVGFHQEYLSALISQSFLDIGSVSRILDSIMKLCLQFCWNIENQESNPNTTELENIAEEFNKKSNSLYTILRSSKLAGSQRAPFLRRFLLRLNFNSFYEATARGVLNVVRQRPALPL
ncbi:PREDICTED: gamma-tubulin complex component 4 isoform X1 [Camelina sativa]|uniref:Gamma-tubulin complex component n=2 Tax=Camelina sativa TaxID=90675 RepID=A0ABM0YPU5_CAMSA|nr:PREDICTED: gamma-tubulin complex component 4 isoform X1 [Camelina sativa]